RPASGEFLDAGPVAVARWPLVFLHYPPLWRAAVDHPRRRARPRRDVRLAHRLGDPDGDRGRVYHNFAPGKRPDRPPLRQPTGMAAPRHLLGNPFGLSLTGEIG